MWMNVYTCGILLVLMGVSGVLYLPCASVGSFRSWGDTFAGGCRCMAIFWVVIMLGFDWGFELGVGFGW